MRGARYLERFLSSHRAFVITAFAVPASFVYGILEWLGNWGYRTFRNTRAGHDEAVRAIQAQVRAGYRSGKRMCTARTPWKSMSLRSADFKQDMQRIRIDLRNILEVDEERRIVRAEPMATMGDITHFLVPKGFALAEARRETRGALVFPGSRCCFPRSLTTGFPLYSWSISAGFPTLFDH